MRIDNKTSIAKSMLDPGRNIKARFIYFYFIIYYSGKSIKGAA